MSCPRNTFGQPACFITSHPDHPQDKFCITCRQRFYQNSTYSRYPQEGSSGIFFLIITVLMLVILFKAIPGRSSNTNPTRRSNGYDNPNLMLQKT